MPTDYRIVIKPKSFWGTPMQSDTLLGMIACMLAEHSDKELNDYLTPFLGSNPEFVISDAFPEGLLPRPLTEHARMVDKSKGYKSKAEFYKYSLSKTQTYLKDADFKCACHSQKVNSAVEFKDYVDFEQPHASVDRLTGTTGEKGNLYHTNQTEYGCNLVVYFRDLKPENNNMQKFMTWLYELSLSGYGRDRSVGQGQFEVINHTECGMFTSFDEANGFINLSSYVPGASDPICGFWKVRHKRGFTAPNRVNPFKKPLLQFEPGSVFVLNSDRYLVKPFYGRAVENVSPTHKAIVQLCHSFSVPAKLDRELIMRAN